MNQYSIKYVREIWEAALVSARTSISWKEVVRDWGFLLDMRSTVT